MAIVERFGGQRHFDRPALLTCPSATVCVTLQGARERALARYSLEEASTRLGRPVQVVEGEPTDGMIVYGPVSPSWRGAALQYDLRCYDPSIPFASVGSPPLWAPEGVAVQDVDLIGGIGRLLTLADEVRIAESARDANGIFRVSALPIARGRVRAEPLVEHHAAALGRELWGLGSELLTPIMLWPAGRRYAVLLTHDTDSVTISAPQEILFNAVKAVVRIDRMRARMAWDGMKQGHDPLSDFRIWTEIESSFHTRSAFFLFGRTVVPRHLNDCRSTVFNQRMVDWGLLRGMADEGWEFGCHPPIRAKENIEEFVRGKDALETRLGRPVHGLRHHYWALDWRQPHLTFRKHIHAGFRYDMSMAWRDAPGFRAGTSLPYRPFDPVLGRALELYELPTTVMDTHVIREGEDPTAAIGHMLGIVKTVRKVGGVLVLDWHTEAGMDKYNFRNQRMVLIHVIREILADSDAWFATPWELVQHWMERRRSLVPGAVA